MEYQVIARKWRPQRFSDVIGQEHVTRTLKNAINASRIAHAYLFVGPRGIGKTTSARIFAKALNCRQRGGDGEPCCACPSCVSIADGSGIDVIEIDAASQSSVDNIRRLREEVMYTPVNSPFKIYIIDEVHMLSTAAWNALLKTIEEPPAHAKFIFATTEAHKVLPTIISRCQRFDLRRITSVAIAKKLREIADSEKISISDGALSAVARAADGGMRDAQSILDQLISFFVSGSGPEGISEEHVLSLFGLTAPAEMEALVRAVLENDKAGVVKNVFTLAEKGKNLDTLLNDTLSFLRGIQMTLLLPDPDTVLDAGPEMLARYRALAGNVRADGVQRLLEALAPAGQALSSAINKQIFLEAALLRAMRSAWSVQIDDIIQRLNQIRKDGGLAPLEAMPPTPSPAFIPAPLPAPAPVAVPVSPVAPALAAPPPVKAAAPVPAPAPAAPVTEPVSPVPALAAPPPVKAAAPVAPVAVPVSPVVPAVAAPPPVKSPAPAPSAPLPAPKDREDAPVISAADGSDEHDAPDVPVPDGVQDDLPDETDRQEDSPDAGLRRDDDYHIRLWHDLAMELEKHVNPILKDYLMEGEPTGWKNHTLTVLFDEEFDESHTNLLKEKLSLINKRLQSLSRDRDASLRIERAAGVSDMSGRAKKVNIQELRDRVSKNAFVQDVLELFDGSIVDIHA